MKMTRDEYNKKCREAAGKFSVGESVEVNDGRGGWMKGVIVDLPTDPTVRVSISSDLGQFKAPLFFLRPAKLSNSAKKELATKGAKFVERRAEVTAKNEASRQRLDLEVISTLDLRRGARVSYQGKETVVLEVLSDGRLTIANPKRNLYDAFALLDLPIEELPKTKKTITVRASSVRFVR